MEKQEYIALSELSPPKKGGHIKWFYEICKYFGNVDLITRNNSDLPKKEEVDGIKIRRVSFGQKTGGLVGTFLFYSVFIAQAAYCCFVNRRPIISARALPEGLIAAVLSKIFGLPSLTIAHGEEINRLRRDNISDKFSTNLKRYLLLLTFRKIDCIISNSKFTYGLLLDEEIIKDKIFIVNPGTDPTFFSPQIKKMDLIKKYNIENKFVLLTIGRLTPRKGQDMVIKSLPQLIIHIPNIVYLVVGNGPYMDSLKSLAVEYGVQKYVIFTGELLDSEVVPFYNLADIFILPNRRSEKTNDVEGFGIVFLEANACEKPVIGGNSGGTGDSIENGKSGFLINSEDVDSIVSAILKFFNDKRLSKAIGVYGRQRVCSSFTWEKSAMKVKRSFDIYV